MFTLGPSEVRRSDSGIRNAHTCSALNASLKGEAQRRLENHAAVILYTFLRIPGFFLSSLLFFLIKGFQQECSLVLNVPAGGDTRPRPLTVADSVATADVFFAGAVCIQGP